MNYKHPWVLTRDNRVYPRLVYTCTVGLQGNGHERDFMDDDRVYIMDMYNRWIYPNDREAKGQGN